jgi:hypothetical protein
MARHNYPKGSPKGRDVKLTAQPVRCDEIVKRVPRLHLI